MKIVYILIAVIFLSIFKLEADDNLFVSDSIYFNLISNPENKVSNGYFISLYLIAPDYQGYAVTTTNILKSIQFSLEINSSKLSNIIINRWLDTLIIKKNIYDTISVLKKQKCFYFQLLDNNISDMANLKVDFSLLKEKYFLKTNDCKVFRLNTSKFRDDINNIYSSNQMNYDNATKLLIFFLTKYNLFIYQNEYTGNYFVAIDM